MDELNLEQVDLEIKKLDKEIEALGGRRMALKERRVFLAFGFKAGQRISYREGRGTRLGVIESVGHQDWGTGYFLWVRRILKAGDIGCRVRVSDWDGPTLLGDNDDPEPTPTV